MKLKGDILKKFAGLACRLSPENLCCDGEISRAEVNKRRRKIDREWINLEKEFGQMVGIREVWTADIEASK